MKGKKLKAKLAARRAHFDAARDRKSGYRKPGSMNPRKQS